MKNIGDCYNQPEHQSGVIVVTKSGPSNGGRNSSHQEDPDCGNQQKFSVQEFRVVLLLVVIMKYFSHRHELYLLDLGKYDCAIILLIATVGDTTGRFCHFGLTSEENVFECLSGFSAHDTVEQDTNGCVYQCNNVQYIS